METARHVRLFRNGRNQTVRIPREFELEGKEAIIRKDGERLIIEPVAQKSLCELLTLWGELGFPEITDPPVQPEEIF